MTDDAALPRTREAFLEWEETQAMLYEFVDGEVRPLPERTRAHGEIASNLQAALLAQVEYFGWVVFLAGARVAVGGDVFHPDVSMTRNADALSGDCIEHPVLVAEVAPSTEMYDRGLKRRRFQELLPSLQTYLLVADDAVAIEVFRRGENFWQYQAYTQADEVIVLKEPPCRLTVAEIYARVLDQLAGKRA